MDTKGIYVSHYPTEIACFPRRVSSNSLLWACSDYEILGGFGSGLGMLNTYIVIRIV
jgi:hypothetical protein